MDPNIFIPRIGENGTLAKKICEQCPVRPQCFNYALGDPEVVGVWGGYNFSLRTKRASLEMMVVRVSTPSRRRRQPA
jgi:hypothetical protein